MSTASFCYSKISPVFICYLTFSSFLTTRPKVEDLFTNDVNLIWANYVTHPHPLSFEAANSNNTTMLIKGGGNVVTSSFQASKSFSLRLKICVGLFDFKKDITNNNL